MTAVKSETRDAAAQFRSLMEKLLQMAPRGSCQLIWKGVQEDASTVAVLQPSDEHCAQIEARLIHEYGIVLKVGSAAVFEVPFQGRRYTQSDFQSEVELLCKGVIEGGFSEVVIMVGAEIVGANGRIDLNGLTKPVKDGWMKIGKSFLTKKRRVQHSYPAYH